MILTVTLNAALDITYRVPQLRPHATHRVTDVAERPGGKGLNVARVLAALGHDTVVTGFAGGVTGTVLRERLAALAGSDGGTGTEPPRGRITDALVPIAGTTRRTIGVVDGSTGDTTQLNEPGPIVSTPEWSDFLTGYARLLREASAVALCGSLPPGVPVGTYAQLIREAHAAGVPTLLDTSGEPLRRGIAARPQVVKPNATELAGLTGTTDPLRASRDARRRGARAVAASLGADGMLAVTSQGTWRARPPRRLAGNPTGAGDSAVAGLLSGLVEEVPWPDRLARAVALSAAAVRAPAAGEFDRAAYDELLGRVEVTEHPAA
ncbi:1-phosphofructokinase family hexose kinase [Streptomyces sp. NA02950]|uniref:1-phosphofructokinase family hexose kinase n=1 Tax=Streptomyces sp. NA02950 TaxID=2742137 RepID=UPI00159092F6|nr:1-phosphofructokinase family hexose kinase [Streptomyces sp. NA02950]QKV94310.1 1-phosphofructokinase family hexose kinase [Streptomyces sp. NA02950]